MKRRSRKPAGEQTELWVCACGESYLVEHTGETISTRHHGTREVVRFHRPAAAAAAAAAAVSKCACGRQLHFIYNRQGANGRPLRRTDVATRR